MKLIGALLLAALAFAEAAPGGPWFGLTLPPGLGDPHKAVADVASAKPPAPKVPAGEEKVTDLQGAAQAPRAELQP